MPRALVGARRSSGVPPGVFNGPMGQKQSKFRSQYESAICHCGKTAHRFVGRQGFCRTHKDEAYTAQRAAWKDR